MEGLQRPPVMVAAEGLDPRIPMAWRHRDMTFNSPGTRRTSSPSVTSTSSDDREEVPMMRHQYRPLSRHSNADRREEQRLDHYATIRNERLEQFSTGRGERVDPYPHRGPPGLDTFFHAPYRVGSVAGSTGTLRSTRSVPALTFTAAMEGPDPCPVHGGGGPHLGPMRRHGSLFDIRSPPIGGPLNLSGLDKKNFYGSKHSMVGGPHPNHVPFHHELPQYLPPHMINPMMRVPHHMGVPVLMEPLPLRDAFNKSMAFQRNQPYPTKSPIDPFSVEQVCCKGHLIVLWIILGVVTVGVILGIIMGVTIT